MDEETALPSVEMARPPESAPQNGLHPRARWQRWFDALLNGRGMVSVLAVPGMGVLLLLGISAMWSQPASDAAKYGCYAYAFWHGGTDFTARASDFPGCAFIQASAAPTPLHTLPLEYPFLALVPFSLPLLAPFAWYQVVFGVVMVLVSASIYWYLARVGPRRAALAFALFLVLGGWGTAAGRFDLVPAGCTLLCLVAAERGQFRRAYLWLGLATMLKLYPLPLLLPLFLAEQRRIPGALLTWRRLLGVGVFAAVCAACFALSLLISVSGTFSPLNYFADRPIQIESLAASMMWGLSLLGAPICTDFRFGSLNIYDRVQGVCTAAAGQAPGIMTASFSMLLLVLLLVGVVLVVWMQWRGRLTLPQAFVALLLVIMLTGKIFSPQYLIWLAPLVAYAQALDLAWVVLWSVVSVLTTVIYPYLYSVTYRIADAPSVPAFYPTVALRNLCFALAVLGFLFDLRGLRSRPAAQSIPNPAGGDTRQSRGKSGGTPCP
jgi:hypothetical protein